MILRNSKLSSLKIPRQSTYQFRQYRALRQRKRLRSRKCRQQQNSLALKFVDVEDAQGWFENLGSDNTAHREPESPFFSMTNLKAPSGARF